MIEIINPVPVFDKEHNVIKFKYNDGLVIHDCLTNTLNVSYLIVSELMCETKTLDNVLSELKEQFSLFSDVKCHDRDFLLDLIKDLVMKVDEEKYPNSIFWFTKDDVLMMKYYKQYNEFVLSYSNIWSVLESEYVYDEISDLCIPILSEHFKIDINIILAYWDNKGCIVSEHFKRIK